MKEYLQNLEAMGRELAAAGVPERLAHKTLLLNLRNAASARYALNAYRTAQPQARVA